MAEARGTARRRGRHRAATSGTRLLICVGIGLGLSACGGAASPGVAGARSSTTTITSPSGLAASSPPSGDVTARMLQFTRCMRTHGVPSFPEPLAPVRHPPSGNQFVGDGPNPNNSPAYRAASAACRDYAVAQPVTPAVAAEVQAQQLQYAHCMRAHGASDYPDPTSNGPMPSSGINAHSPAYQAAGRECRGLLTGPPGAPGIGGN